MINIILDNAESRILGLEKSILLQLRMEVCFFNMSIWVRTRNSHAARTYLIDENGFFPTGLLHRVQGFLLKKMIQSTVIDNRILPKDRRIEFNNLIEEPTAYPEQSELARIFHQNISGTGVIPTGVGKTRIIKEALILHKRPSLIITPSANLKQQMHDYLLVSFGSKYVGMMGDGKAKPITVTNYHSISSTPVEYFSAFDAVYFDEYHNAANNTIRELNKTHLSKIYYKYGLTATNFKNDDSQQILLECVLSNNLYEMKPIDAINKGYIVPVVPVFFNLQNSDLHSEGNYKTDLKKFIDTNEERNGIAIEYAQKMVQQNISTLILVEHMEHGRFIANSLKDFVFINGQDENAKFNMSVIKDFNEGKIAGVIGTSVIGEGVDTKRAGAVFNLAGGKARSELQQRIGRIVRKFPGKKSGYYFDFIDNRQKHLLKHSKERISIIEETYGTKVVKR